MKLIRNVNEMECTEDGVTLLYGTMRNREEGELPRVKEN